jgi:hypothetical protein
MAEHLYEAAVQKTTGAAAGAIVSILPGTLGAGIRIPEIREIGIYNVSGVAAEFGIGLPAALGTGGVSVTQLVLPLNQIDVAGHTSVVSSYATLQPTVPGAFNRRAELQAVIGAGAIWTWNPGEFALWSGATINAPVIWQISVLAVTYDVYVKVAE